MATGADREDDDAKDLDTQGGGQSAGVGVPADGQLEGSVFNPLGNPGMRHWQASYIDKSGLEDCGTIFFAAVEVTSVPMVVTDPRQPDNPIVFVNRAFLDLSVSCRSATASVRIRVACVRSRTEPSIPDR